MGPDQDLRSSTGYRRGAPSQLIWQEPTGTSSVAGYRVVAKLIDVIVVYVIIYAMMIPFTFIWFSRFNALTLEEWTIVGEIPWEFFALIYGAWGILLLLMFLYYFLSEYFAQQTLGKKLFNLKVVTTSGRHPGVFRIFVRSVFTVISVTFYAWIVEIIVMLIRDDGRRITDMIVGTNVIRIAPRTVASNWAEPNDPWSAGPSEPGARYQPEVTTRQDE